MKKYFMAFVDFSEIANITANMEQLDRAKARMAELGLLTEKGNPSPSQIGSLSASVSTSFFGKLQRRLSHRYGGITAVRETMQKDVYKRQAGRGIHLN